MSKHLAATATIAQRIITKADPMQAKLAFPFCDVRDVANVHVKVRLTIAFPGSCEVAIGDVPPRRQRTAIHRQQLNPLVRVVFRVPSACAERGGVASSAPI
jgi:hypothetical protein